MISKPKHGNQMLNGAMTSKFKNIFRGNRKLYVGRCKTKLKMCYGKVRTEVTLFA